MEEKKKTDEEVLFTKEKIAGYTITPWSFGTLFEIGQMLDIIFDELDKRKIVLDDVDFLSYTFMVKLFSIASPQIKKIISITLDTSEDNVDMLSMKDGINITLVIFKQNFDIIKNELGLTFLEEKINEEEKTNQMTQKETDQKIKD